MAKLPSQQGAPNEASSVKSAVRTLEILGRLGAAGRSMPAAELQTALGIPKSSLHSLLSTMMSMGWVVLDAYGGGFSLGPSARGLSSADGGISVAVLADEILEELRDRADETAHLGRLDEQSVLYLVSKYASHALGVHFYPGRRVPSYATALGKAMLAECAPDEIEAHLPKEFQAFTARTLTSEADLRLHLEMVRRQGYAVDDEESAVGLRCFAMSVPLGRFGHHAISCSAPTARLNPKKEQSIIEFVFEARQRLIDKFDAATSKTEGSPTSGAH